MFDIITFGSAILDNFLEMKPGSKVFIDNLKAFSGGGGTNTACSFALKGFKTAYFGKVGDDEKGEAIIKDLKRFGVDVRFVKKDKKYPTAYSFILSSKQERMILIQKGASHFLKKDDLLLLKKQTQPMAKWFYIAPLSGESAKVFNVLANFAKKNKIKIAANMGNSQISLGIKALRPILSFIDVLFLNLEEACLLTKLLPKDKKKILKKLFGLCPNLVALTMAKKGVLVYDGKKIYKTKPSFISVKEKTGAGDAFASGFLSGLLKKNDIEYALQIGMANANSCIQQVGAKNGLLR